MKILIKHHVMWCLIGVCTVCGCPIKWTLDLYEGSAVAQWYSAKLETEGPSVRASPALLRCGPWARHIYPSLVLVQPRKTRPCLTEILLMGRKESNHTNKLTHLGWMEVLPTLISRTSPFPTLGVLGSNLQLQSNFTLQSVSKQWRSWSDTTLCGVWSGSAMFAYYKYNAGVYVP